MLRVKRSYLNGIANVNFHHSTIAVDELFDPISNIFCRDPVNSFFNNIV